MFSSSPLFLPWHSETVHSPLSDKSTIRALRLSSKLEPHARLFSAKQYSILCPSSECSFSFQLQVQPAFPPVTQPHSLLVGLYFITVFMHSDVFKTASMHACAVEYAVLVVLECTGSPSHICSALWHRDFCLMRRGVKPPRGRWILYVTVPQ